LPLPGVREASNGVVTGGGAASERVTGGGALQVMVWPITSSSLRRRRPRAGALAAKDVSALVFQTTVLSKSRGFITFILSTFRTCELVK
jgi:hypothetical protein